MPRKKYQYTAEEKERVSKERKNRIPWNKGLTKETDERVAKNAKATSIGLKGHMPSEKARKIASEKWKGKNNPAHDPAMVNKRIQTRREKYDWLFLPLCRSCHMKTGFNRYYWFNLLANQWAIHPEIILDENILSSVKINTSDYEYCSGIDSDKPFEMKNEERSLFYFVGDN